MNLAILFQKRTRIGNLSKHAQKRSYMLLLSPIPMRSRLSFSSRVDGEKQSMSRSCENGWG